MKSSRRFELLCAFMLGFGQMCIMTGYDSESFILESVIHSIHQREPGTISNYAGYYGQALLYFIYMLTCFVAPSIMNVIGAKSTLFISTLCFTSFPIGFLFINSYYYYFSVTLLGAGLSLFYIGQGGYLMSHSTRKSIESNVSMSWAVSCVCMILGSAILGIMTNMNANVAENVERNTSLVSENQYRFERNFSDHEIKMLFISFTIASALAIINSILLPSKEVENCIESSDKRQSFIDGLVLTYKTTISKKILHLIPLFALCGINTSVFLAIIPTSMTFTTQNANLIYLTAVYSFGAGIGEIFMGLLISFLSKRIKDFGLQPTMIIGAIAITLSYFLIHVSTPFTAPLRASSESPLLFHHTYTWIFVIALLLGVGDCCVNSVRSVICAIMMPDRRAQAFSVSRLYQAFSASLVLFFSPHLTLPFYTIGIPALAIFSTIKFLPVARRIQAMEKILPNDESPPKV